MLGIALSDDYGSLTLNNGVIYKDGDTVCATIDIRFPVTMITKQIIGLMEENLEGQTKALARLLSIHTARRRFFPKPQHLQNCHCMQSDSEEQRIELQRLIML